MPHLAINAPVLRTQKTLPHRQRALSDRWNTLEELRHLALERGFSSMQVDKAIEAVGANPSDVADHLHRWGLLMWMQNKAKL